MALFSLILLLSLASWTALAQAIACDAEAHAGGPASCNAMAMLQHTASASRTAVRQDPSNASNRSSNVTDEMRALKVERDKLEEENDRMRDPVMEYGDWIAWWLLLWCLLLFICVVGIVVACILCARGFLTGYHEHGRARGHHGHHGHRGHHEQKHHEHKHHEHHHTVERREPVHYVGQGDTHVYVSERLQSPDGVFRSHSASPVGSIIHLRAEPFSAPMTCGSLPYAQPVANNVVPRLPAVRAASLPATWYAQPVAACRTRSQSPYAQPVPAFTSQPTMYVERAPPVSSVRAQLVESVSTGRGRFPPATTIYR